MFIFMIEVIHVYIIYSLFPCKWTIEVKSSLCLSLRVQLSPCQISLKSLQVVSPENVTDRHTEELLNECYRTWFYSKNCLTNLYFNKCFK